jgi:hypothetical protein
MRLSIQTSILDLPTHTLFLVAELAQESTDTMAENGGRFPVSPNQLTTELEPVPRHKPISDIKLVEHYCSINIRDKLARRSAMPEPNLRHLVALYNMYDAIVSGKHKQSLERIRAHHNDMYRAWPSRTSLCYEGECCKTTDGLSSASTQCDESLRFRLDNLHLNF